MLSFHDLVRAGIARFDYKNLHPASTTKNDFVRLYNNVWGILNDTHMTVVDDGAKYVITGSAIRLQDKFNTSLWSCRMVDGHQRSFSSIMDNAGYSGRFAIVNGDETYIFTRVTGGVPGCGCDCCAAQCLNCACEGNKPQMLGAIISEDEFLSVFNGTNTNEAVVELLNKSRHAAGKNWMFHVSEGRTVFHNEFDQHLEFNVANEGLSSIAGVEVTPLEGKQTVSCKADDDGGPFTFAITTDGWYRCAFKNDDYDMTAFFSPKCEWVFYYYNEEVKDNEPQWAAVSPEKGTKGLKPGDFKKFDDMCLSGATIPEFTSFETSLK